jgi:hypothetical protein
MDKHCETVTKQSGSRRESESACISALLKAVRCGAVARKEHKTVIGGKNAIAKTTAAAISSSSNLQQQQHQPATIAAATAATAAKTTAAATSNSSNSNINQQ